MIGSGRQSTFSETRLARASWIICRVTTWRSWRLSRSPTRRPKGTVLPVRRTPRTQMMDAGCNLRGTEVMDLRVEFHSLDDAFNVYTCMIHTHVFHYLRISNGIGDILVSFMRMCSCASSTLTMIDAPDWPALNHCNHFTQY